MGTEAFPNLGSHCNESSCHLLDFLPFTCDNCNQVFCLEHRSYQAHDCPKADLKDVSVLLCPVCASSVRRVSGQDPNLTLEAHFLGGTCDPTNYERTVKKPRCPVKRCREALTFSNTHTCKTCKLQTCLKHRYPLDHACGSNNNTHVRVNSPQGLVIRKEAAKLAHDFIRILSDRGATECGTSSTTTKEGTTPPKNVQAH